MQTVSDADDRITFFGKQVTYTSALISTLLLSAICRTGIFLFFSGGKLTGDYLGYWTMASGMYDGTGLRFESNFAELSAGYPILLGTVFLIFGKSIAYAHVVNVVLGVLTTWLIVAICKRVFNHSLGAIIAGLLWSTYLASIVYTTYLARENITIPLMLVMIYAAVQILRRQSISFYSSVAGLAGGAVMVAGPSGVALVPAVLWALARSGRPVAQRAKGLLAFILCAAVVLTPWLYRNYLVLGSPVIDTNVGFNLYIGNNPKATSYFMSIKETDLGTRWQELRKNLGELGTDRYCRDQAFKYISEHPMSALGLSIKKVFVFWTPPYHLGADGEQGSRGELIVRRLWLIQWIAIVILATVPMWRRGFWRNDRLNILIISIVFYTALHGIFYVIYRYRLPAMAILVVMAGEGTCLLYTTFGTHLERNRLLRSRRPVHIHRANP